jgi:putative transposase
MRLPRINFVGALYQVFSRGNNRAPLFLDDADRETFLGLLREIKAEFQIRCYAYALMEDHFHLLVETPQANLSKAMQHLFQGYTRYFNRRYDRSGHLFESRYKCRLVQRERYLLPLVRYIHQSPVHAGMTASVAAYPWSSHADYVVPRSGSVADPGEVLKRFDSDLDVACREYGEFVAGTISAKEWTLLDRKKNGVLGDAAFRAEMRRSRERAALSPILPPELMDDAGALSLKK